MQIELGNQFLTLRLSLPSGMLDVRSLTGRTVEVANGHLGLTGSAHSGRFAWNGELADAMVEGPSRGPSPAGAASVIRITVMPPGVPLQLCLEAAVPQELPLLFWRLKATNILDQSVQLDRFDLLRAGHPLSARGPGGVGGIRFDGEGPRSFYVNGWQSWSYAGTLQAGDRQPRSLFGPLMRSRHEIPGVRLHRRRGDFVSDLYGVLLAPQLAVGLLAGFTAQRQMFGRVQVQLHDSSASLHLLAPSDGVLLAPSASLISDWACLQPVDLTRTQPLDPYLLAAAAENGARSDAPSPTGWCSWYQFFANLNGERIEQNLDWIARNRNRYPLRVVQLDDGYEANVGDWDQLRPSLSLSLNLFSQRIASAGGIPGLWMAPFVAAHNSRVVRDHPDWVLRKRGGSPVGVGYAWGLRTRALDVSHPDVREFTQHTVRTAIDSWGFRYLKLDFLYAGALIGERHDPTQTRAQAYSQALREIRHTSGSKVHLLGCGGPLGPGIGIFDSMRIGPDVAVGWYPSYPGLPALPRKDREFPAVKNALRSALNRAHLHRRWWVNDADCVLLRPAGRVPEQASYGATSRLTQAEVETLLTINSMLAGSMIVSDHLPALPEARLAWLSRMLPVLPDGARVLGWESDDHPETLLLSLRGAVGVWTLVARVNWSDRETWANVGWGELGLEPQPGGWHVVDFWRSRYQGVQRDLLQLGMIPPHGTSWVAVRPVRSQPSWVGDTLHASQGALVQSFSTEDAGFRAILAPTHPTSGMAWLRLPEGAPEFRLDGLPVEAVPVGQGVYCLDLSIHGHCELEGRALRVGSSRSASHPAEAG